jgi:hypothetical protein
MGCYLSPIKCTCEFNESKQAIILLRLPLPASTILPAVLFTHTTLSSTRCPILRTTAPKRRGPEPRPSPHHSYLLSSRSFNNLVSEMPGNDDNTSDVASAAATNSTHTFLSLLLRPIPLLREGWYGNSVRYSN